jgi:predicted glycogen debranching enzyme
MKIGKKELSLKDGIRKEWVITNGLGAICSSSVLGANTRRYHGLLVAPLMPPARRHLLISKLDETIKIGNESFNLYTNVCENFVSDGFKYLQSFEKEYVPIFNYEVQGVKIEKKISMVYRRNTVVVTYKIINKNEKAVLTLTPVINFRDFHNLTSGHFFSLKQKIDGSKVRVEVDGNSATPIYMFVDGAGYIEHINDTFENMYYLKEDERGFYPEENLAVPGRFEIQIEPNEVKEITFVGSLEENIEEINGFKVIEKEIERLKKVVATADLKISKEKMLKQDEEYNNFIDDLVVATDNFIIYRPSFGLHSILAGIPWFLDWGRDAMISFEGAVLIPKRFDIAKEILLTFTRDVKYGLVPNGYSGFDNRPLYNSVDSSLLLFEQVNKYIKYTGDYDFIKENIYECLKTIITNYSKGINIDDNNIYIDRDGLVSSGTENTQNTWMDVKINGFAVTPRNGKVVEINALWYNALKILEALAIKFSEPDVAENCKKVSAKHKREFNKKFYNEKKKCLYDVLGDGKIRPNQLFALSLSNPVWNFKSEHTYEIFNTVTDKLLLKYGLRTLAKNEKEYIPVYEGDSFKRDMSYHQGIPWPWLLGLYLDTLKNLIAYEKDKKQKLELQEKYNKFVETTYNTFKKEINSEECIGGISEVYDAKAPYKPGGACNQAWSVAEVLRIVVEYKKLL